MEVKQSQLKKGYEDEKPAPTEQLNNPIVREIVNQQPSKTDPNGSYTGKPIEPYELPQQDADDL